MRKTFTCIFLTLTLAVGFIAPAPASQVKEGMPCNKNKAVKILNSEKYICKKIKKKLTWTSNTGVKREKIALVITEELIDTKKDSVPVIEQKLLTLQSSIESGTHLRLELSEDVYLGHCASFLVYPWGIADTYEGVFYRQNKEYLVPVDLSSKENLPLSFTFGCSGYPIQSYSIEWALSENAYSPTVIALQTAIDKSTIRNLLPEKFDFTTPGEIRVGFPRIENVQNSLIFQDDGYFATETLISFGVNKLLDSCVSRILNGQGVDVKNRVYGPGNSSSYNVPGLLPSGFDRLNGFGYVSYKSSKNEELKLEISCLGSGDFSSTFFHPAPKILLNVVEEAKCPSSYKDQTLPSIKPANLELTCKEDSRGDFTWTSIPKMKVVPANPSASNLPISAEEQKKLNVMIQSAQKLGLKARKIQQILHSSLKSPASKRNSAGKTASINTLISQAEEIILRIQKLNTISNFSQGTAEISQIVQNFNTLETTYGEVLESS